MFSLIFLGVMGIALSLVENNINKQKKYMKDN